MQALEADVAVATAAIGALISALPEAERKTFAMRFEQTAQRARDLVSDLPLAEAYFQAFDARVALFRAFAQQKP